jgi:2-isopropylmalate synthase
MAKQRLYLFDTTMRDGALTTGVDFSLDDKRHIAAMLDRLGVDYVEGGYPGANPLLRVRDDQASRPLSRQ